MTEHVSAVANLVGFNEYCAKYYNEKDDKGLFVGNAQDDIENSEEGVDGLIAKSNALLDAFEVSRFDNRPTKEITEKFGLKTDVPFFTPDQRRAGFMMNPFGLRKSILLYHSLGSGKTNTALHIAETVGARRKFILSSHNENFFENIFKYTNIDWESEIVRGSPLASRFLSKVITTMKQIYDEENNPRHSALIGAINRTDLEKRLKKVFKDNNYENLGYLTFANKVRDMDEKTIKEVFRGTMIIMDEVHHIKSKDFSEEAEAEVDSKANINTLLALQRVVKLADEVRLVALSATPMFNSYEDLDDIIELFFMNERIGYDPAVDKLKVSKGVPTPHTKELIEEFSSMFVSYVYHPLSEAFPRQLGPQMKSPLAMDIASFKNAAKYDQIASLEVVVSPIVNTGPGNLQYAMYKKVHDEYVAAYSSDVVESLDFAPNHQSALDYDRILTEVSNIVTSTSLAVKGESKMRLPGLIRKPGGGFGYTPAKEFVDNPTKFPLRKEFLANYSSKLATVIDLVSKQPGRIIIYSRYINNGILPIAAALETMGYSRYVESDPSVISWPPSFPRVHNLEDAEGYKLKYAVISKSTDSVSPANTLKRNKAAATTTGDLKDCKVFIISQAGTEGIDFKAVRHIHIFEPWYNFSRLMQVVGRGVRRNSHSLLPPEQREVSVYLHASALVSGAASGPKSIAHSIDLKNYVSASSKIKDILEVATIIKQNAIDCNYNSQEVVVDAPSYFTWNPPPCKCGLKKTTQVPFKWGLPLLIEEVRVISSIIKKIIEENVVMELSALKEMCISTGDFTPTQLANMNTLFAASLRYMENRPVHLTLTMRDRDGNPTNDDVQGTIVCRKLKGDAQHGDTECVIFRPLNTYDEYATVEERTHKVKLVPDVEEQDDMSSSDDEDVVADIKKATVVWNRLLVTHAYVCDLVANVLDLEGIAETNSSFTLPPPCIAWMLALETVFLDWVYLFRYINAHPEDVPAGLIDALSTHHSITLTPDGKKISKYSELVRHKVGKKTASVTIEEWAISDDLREQPVTSTVHDKQAIRMLMRKHLISAGSPTFEREEMYPFLVVNSCTTKNKSTFKLFKTDARHGNHQKNPRMVSSGGCQYNLTSPETQTRSMSSYVLEALSMYGEDADLKCWVDVTAAQAVNCPSVFDYVSESHVRARRRDINVSTGVIPNLIETVIDTAGGDRTDIRSIDSKKLQEGAITKVLGEAGAGFKMDLDSGSRAALFTVFTYLVIAIDYKEIQATPDTAVPHVFFRSAYASRCVECFDDIQME